MRQTLGTKITGPTARYYLPFRLPSDVYFSEIFIKTVNTSVGVDEAIPVFIRVLYYENEGDYLEDSSGNPIGNPLVLFSGWVRTNYNFDYIRVPINFLVDILSYGRFFITADFAGGWVGQLLTEVIYSDVVTNAISSYNHKDNWGRLRYTNKIVGTGATMEFKFTPQSGVIFRIHEMELIIGTGMSSTSTGYNFNDFTKMVTYAVTNGDRINLDTRYRGLEMVGDAQNYQYLEVEITSMPLNAEILVYLEGFVSTANLPTTTISNGTLSNEIWKIF